jgi:hypothetical protein
MAAVSETIVREYFELNGFLVRQFRKYLAPAGREDDDIDFLVLNPQPLQRTGERPFLLGSPDLGSIERAIVILKAWHTEVFSPALLTNTPDFFRFLEKKTFQHAAAEFGKSGTLLKILALPALPQDAQARDQSIAILRERGLDAVISFRTMLADLVNHVEPNRNYQKSDLLQLIRVLKTYDFVKDQQLELFRGKRTKDKMLRRDKKATPAVTDAPPDEMK